MIKRNSDSFEMYNICDCCEVYIKKYEEGDELKRIVCNECWDKYKSKLVCILCNHSMKDFVKEENREETIICNPCLSNKILVR